MYHHPADVAANYAVRRWEVGPHRSGPWADDKLQTAEAYEQLLTLLPPGLFRLPRSPEDEPQVIETWVTIDAYVYIAWGLILQLALHSTLEPQADPRLEDFAQRRAECYRQHAGGSNL